MVEPAEMAPDELDRLEDALELVEVADIDDPSPIVRQRLGDFRRILQLSRTALPSVDVPAGILERVMLEARQAAEVPAVTPLVDASPPVERPGLWARMRRFALVPGVALVGAAAMVLIIVERSPEQAVVARAPESTASITEKDSERASAASTPVQGAQAESPPPADAEAAGSGALPGARPRDAVTDMPMPTAAPAVVAPERKQDDGSALQESDKAAKEETTVDAGGTPRWDIIARGDRARQKDDCVAARTEYKLALGDPDARVRARAHAGIGLCAASGNDWSAAESAYKAARELDPEITGFIDAERPRGSGSTVPKAARKSASKTKAAPPVNADDAFENAEPQQQKRE